MEAGYPDDAFVLVVCPHCRARLHPRRELIGKRVRCPDCHEPVRVEEPHAPPVVSRAAESAGEYRLAGDEQPVDPPETVLAVCPTCGTRLHPRADLVGKRVRCPDCGTPVRVTATKEESSRPWVAPTEYRVGAEPAANPALRTELLPHEREEIEKETQTAPAPLPRAWYWTGVVSFPWYRDSISCWGTLSLAFLIANTLTTALFVSMPLLTGDYNVGSALMTVASIAGSMIIWGLSLAFIVTAVIAIIRETAASNDEITDWSEMQLFEGMWQSLYLWLPLVGAGGVAYLVYQGVGAFHPGLAIVAGGIVMAILFPIMFMSVLEEGSPIALVTGTVLRFVAVSFGSWLLVLFEGSALIVLWVGLTHLGFRYSPYLSVVIGAPILAAIVMIEARLLGRFMAVAGGRLAVIEEKFAEEADDEEEAEE